MKCVLEWVWIEDISVSVTRQRRRAIEFIIRIDFRIWWKKENDKVFACACVWKGEREPSERARKKLSENKEKKIQQAKNCLATIAMLGAPLLNSIGLLGCSMAKYTLIWELIGNCRCRRQCGNLQQIANQYDIMYALRTYLLNFNKCNYFFFVLFTVISTK